MHKYFSTLFILYIITLCAQAQNPPSLQSFKVEIFQNEVLISWEIASGNLCSGLKVQHSADSINFTSIYDYPGICGSSSVSEHYTYSHQQPLPNSFNYYRIDLNTNGTSEILKIFYADLRDVSYSLFPNPVNASTNLYFNNANNDLITFIIYNSAGLEIVKQSNIQTGLISLGNLNLPNGIYHFRIEKGKDIINGKFVI